LVAVERHVVRARLEDGELSHDQLRGALHQHRHSGVGAGARGGQPVGQPVRAGVQLGVAQRTVGGPHRPPVRAAAHLLGEPLHDAAPRHRAGGALEAGQQPLPLGGGQHVEPPHLRVRRAGEQLERAHQAQHGQPGRGSIETVGAVQQAQPQPLTGRDHQRERLVIGIADAHQPQPVGSVRGGAAAREVLEGQRRVGQRDVADESPQVRDPDVVVRQQP
jgi:hypothetical protein